jgi:polysaccharide chain length determinant protein (PEP-CTERM system associated)
LISPALLAELEHNMIENRELTMDDYLAMLRRRLKVILIPTLLTPLVGFAVSYAFSPKYTSTSQVLVEEQKVPEGYVKPAITEDLSQRVATLQQLALGADRLRPLIDRLQLAKGNRSVDDVIQDIRLNTTIEQIDTTLLPTPGKKKLQGDLPGFNLSYTASSPLEAQEVCTGVTDIMLQENLKDRAQVAQSTTEFLGRQVEEAKRTLDALDGQLAAFKQKYVGQLPGDEDSNLKILMGMNSQLDANTQTLSRAQQDKAYTESLLSQQLAAWKSSQTSTNPQNLEQQLATLQSQLITLQGRYTEDYPDVVKTKKDIAELQKKLKEINSAAADAPAATTTPDQASLSEPAEIQQLRLQIHQYQQVITQATRDQQRLQEQIKIYQGRVALSPAVEEQYRKLTRDYDTAQKFYDDKSKQEKDSETQTAMEREAQGEQMHLQRPADLPDSPTFPNRLFFAVGGLAGGLALGFGLAMWLELRDQAVRTERDVLAVLALPVLSQVPWVGVETAEKNGNGKRKFGFRSKSEDKKETVEV